MFWVEGERGSRFGVGGASSHHMPQSYEGRKIDNSGFVGFAFKQLLNNFARTSRTTEMFADLFRSEGLAIDWRVRDPNLTKGCGDVQNFSKTAKSLEGGVGPFWQKSL